MDGTVSINEKMTVEITNNKMNAFVIFDAPINEGRELTRQEIIKEIERNSIKKGIDKQVLASILQYREHGKRYLLATGLESKIGEAGKVVTNFDISKQSFKPILQQDGTVDYKNLDNITLAKKGEIIAKLIPPTKGEDGYNIPGEVLTGKEGKSVLMPKGKGTVVSEDGVHLIAETDGRIIYLDGKISVSDLFEVQGDVGPSTGNVNFNGSVVVRGNVITDFTIKATGNVEIFGVVEGAEIYSGGNILVSKGIAGLNKAFLQATGNITCKLIQNANLDARGDIFSEAIMHSNVKTRGKIEVAGKKGLLVGGITQADSGIHAKVVGSYLGTRTELHIGGDTDHLSEFNRNVDELNKLKSTYRENIQYLDSILKNKDNISNIKGVRTSLLNTVNKTKELKVKIDQLQEKVEEVRKLVETDLTRSVLEVENVMYQGAVVRIGNAKLQIDREEYKCKLRNDNGKIKITPI